MSVGSFLYEFSTSAGLGGTAAFAAAVIGARAVTHRIRFDREMNDRNLAEAERVRREERQREDQRRVDDRVEAQRQRFLEQKRTFYMEYASRYRRYLDKLAEATSRLDHALWMRMADEHVMYSEELMEKHKAKLQEVEDEAGRLDAEAEAELRQLRSTIDQVSMLAPPFILAKAQEVQRVTSQKFVRDAIMDREKMNQVRLAATEGMADLLHAMREDLGVNYSRPGEAGR